MKKTVVLTIFLIGFLSSCSSTKVARQSERGLRGDWTLSKITNSEGSLVNLSNLLGNNSEKCLEGSQWHLVANNNKGHYTLSGNNCTSEAKEINWHNEEENGVTYFWFKNIGKDQKARKVLSGYKLKIESITETAAHLSQEVPFENGKIVVNYFFSK